MKTKDLLKNNKNLTILKKIKEFSVYIVFIFTSIKLLENS